MKIRQTSTVVIECVRFTYLPELIAVPTSQIFKIVLTAARLMSPRRSRFFAGLRALVILVADGAWQASKQCPERRPVDCIDCTSH